MHLVGERKLPDAAPPQTLSNLIQTATTPQNNLPAEYVHRAAWKAGVLGALNVLIMVTAVRIIALVAVSGGIVLTSIALAGPDPWRLVALAIYSVCVVIPVIWLTSRH
jgi:hypothetical protein